MNKSVLIIKGFSKSEVELVNDRKIIQLYIDYFTCNAGGCFDFDKEIYVLEEPSIEEIRKLDFLSFNDYLIVILIGHGANKDGNQIFQLKEELFIEPGQIQFGCKKQLYIIESCRTIIDFELDIKRINRLIPKYMYGGIVKSPYTREESLDIFNKEIEKSDNGITYIFACGIGESAYSYFFLQVLIDISIYLHEYYRERCFGVLQIFDSTKKQVSELSAGKQTPEKIGEVNFPFVITIN